jgi:hypothetical protein
MILLLNQKHSMKRYSRLIAISIAMLFLSAAHAAREEDITFSDGNALLAVCGDWVNSSNRGSSISEKEAIMATGCSSYLRGLQAGAALLSNELKQSLGYCIEPSMSMLQINRVVVKYLQDNPKFLHFHPAVLVDQALKESFPCK